MVKSGVRLFLMSFIVFVLLINLVYAVGTNLEFSDVDVKVGSKTSKNLKDGDTIDEEAEPGDVVEFRVEVRNNFTSAQDLDIEDISVEVTIEEIDDGDDLEEESAEFDLKAGKDKKVTLKFKVPLEVDEDTFDVLIHAEGEDENGTNHEIDMKLRLEVNKENHLLMITKKTLSPAEITCNRKNVQLAATVINIGNEDEEDITFQVSNSDLGVAISGNIGELTAEPNEDESKFSKTYSFNVPDNVEAGSYPITLSATYEDGRKKAEDTATLTVNDCATLKPPVEDLEKLFEEEEEVEVTTPPITGRTTAPPAQEELPEGTIVTQESFLKSNTFVIGVIFAEVIAVVFGIILVVVLFRRR